MITMRCVQRFAKERTNKPQVNVESAITMLRLRREEWVVQLLPRM